MASDRPGYVGSCPGAFGDEIKFFEVQGRIVIDGGGLSIVLDAAQREQFQRAFMAAERAAEAYDA